MEIFSKSVNLQIMVFLLWHNVMELSRETRSYMLSPFLCVLNGWLLKSYFSLQSFTNSYKVPNDIDLLCIKKTSVLLKMQMGVLFLQ